MNWDAIGAIGEIIGALAVVVSILFLSFQVRSNTRTEKASASFQATHSWAEMNDISVNLPNELYTDFFKLVDPSLDSSSVSRESKTRIHCYYRSLFQRLEGQYFLHKYGLLESGVWHARISWAAGLVVEPFFDKWWAEEIDQSIYSDEFIEAVNSADRIKNKVTPGVEI